MQSGGHTEIVKKAGAGFEEAEQIPKILDRIVDKYVEFRDLISVPSIETVAEEYLKTLELL